MKTLKNYLFIAALFSITIPAISQENSDSKKNMSIVEGLYKAFAVGDIPAVLGGLDPNVVWNEAEGNAYADGNPYIGPDAVLNGVFARIGADHEYFNLKDIVLHEMSNGKVLATLRYDAKHKNGNSYNAQVAHLWSLKDGKVVSFQQYVDTKKLSDAFNQ
ncbi:MAG: ketosteroid isomerase [Cyclobacterium sp.]|nr:ketosteroid isomerase [Cyclobacterium sp.]